MFFQWKNFKKNGFYRAVEVANIVVEKVYARFISRDYGSWGADEIPNYIELLKQHSQVSTCIVNDINSEASINKIKSFNPTLGVSLAAPILKKQVIDVATQGNLNLHKGELPN